MNVMKIFAIALVVGLFSHTAQAADTGNVRAFKINGNVTLKNDQTGKVSPLALGKAFGQGYTVITGNKSSVLLVFSNGSTINVDEKSSLSVSKFLQEKFDKSKGTYLDLNADPSVSNTQLQLNYGELAFKVKKLSAGSTFNVNTEVGSAGIRGTSGSVTVIKQGNTVKVKVTNAGGQVVWLKMVNGQLQADAQGQAVLTGTSILGNLSNAAGSTQGEVTSAEAAAAELEAIKTAVEKIDVPKKVQKYIKAVLELENALETGDETEVAAAEQELRDAVTGMQSDDVRVTGTSNEIFGPVDLEDAQIGNFDEDYIPGAEGTVITDLLNNQTTTTDDDDDAEIYIGF